MATITLKRREEGLVDRARAYRVFIDGEGIDKIKRGEHKTFPVEAGEHVVELKIDWMRSQPVEVSVPDGGEVELYCEPRGKPVQYLFLMLFRPAHYIELRQIDGKSGGQAAR